jgi:N-acetylglucosamine-6-phosphate deacetylase
VIRRRDGRLTLEDGTLAGADLDLTTAIRTLVQTADVDLAQALAAATTWPAALIGHDWGLKGASPPLLSEMILLAPDLTGFQPAGG